MAGHLKPPAPGWRVLGLSLALVLVAHAIGLGWLALQWQTPAVLKPMLAPVLTRQIKLEAPVEITKPVPARVETARQATKSVATEPDPETATPPQITPTVAETQPDPSPTSTVAALPVPAASAPDFSSSGSVTIPPFAARAEMLARWPLDTRLSYVLQGNYRGPLSGDAQVLWQREADRYQVQVEIKLGWIASVVMTSQGRVGLQGLFPLAYDEKLPGVHRTVLLGEEQLTLGDGQQQPRPARVQDTASQFVELTWRFLSGQIPLEQGAIVHYPMARPGGVDEWVYDVVGQETLNTRFGAVPAWHLLPRPLAKQSGQITAEMWFAPSLQYLPVRIKMNLGDGAYVDLLIDKVEQASIAS